MGPKRLLSLITVIGLLFLCTACATLGVSPTSLDPTCTALVGPIKYNTFVKTSQRYAGPALAPDLKARNQVGQYLGCPLYKVKP
jgi:hypothetical protein